MGSEFARKADVLVIGGGPAGAAAAMMAAEMGAQTLLVERYGRLGGMMSSALVGPIMGACESKRVDAIVKRLESPCFAQSECDMKLAEMLLERKAGLLLHTWAFKALMAGGRVCGVETVSKEGLGRSEAKIVVDASGDGDIAASAGVPFEMGRKSDGLTQPMSIMFHLGGVEKSKALACGSEEEAKRVRLPDGGTWEEAVMAAHKSGELPERIGVVRIYEGPFDRRIVNATQVNYVDGTKAEDLSEAEIEGRRQALQVTEFVRRHAPGYEKAFIAEMPAVAGVRETRRFKGLERLEKEDLTRGRKWQDAVVRGACFCIDIHNPDGGGQAEGIAERAKPYEIPYGCLVPSGADGLLLAGRCISGSHEAHASYRVMRICMGTGTAAGAAAALCALKGVQPRELEALEVQKALFG